MLQHRREAQGWEASAQRLGCCGCWDSATHAPNVCIAMGWAAVRSCSRWAAFLLRQLSQHAWNSSSRACYPLALANAGCDHARWCDHAPCRIPAASSHGSAYASARCTFFARITSHTAVWLTSEMDPHDKWVHVEFSTSSSQATSCMGA